MRRLLLVGVGQSGTPYLEAARELGVQVVLVENPDRLGALAGKYVRGVPVNGVSERAWTVAALRAVHAGGAPDAVLAFSEPQVLAAAHVQAALGLPGPSLRAASISRDKAVQRCVFDLATLPQPYSRLYTGTSEDLDWVRAHGQVILKPTSGSGSAGVRLLTEETALAALDSAVPGEFLLESLAEGPEYSWEALVQNGDVVFENVTAKETTGAPRFVEVGHRAGHVFAATSSNEITRLTRDVVAAIGMHTGIVHLEFRFGEQGPSIMEVAVRTPGDGIMDIVGSTWDVNLYRESISLALGEEVAITCPSTPVQYAGSWLPSAPPGTVTSVRGLDVLRKDPDVIKASVFVRPMDVVGDLTSSHARVGSVLLCAPTEALLEHAMDRVRDVLVIETRQEPSVTS